MRNKGAKTEAFGAEGKRTATAGIQITISDLSCLFVLVRFLTVLRAIRD